MQRVVGRERIFGGGKPIDVTGGANHGGPSDSYEARFCFL
jgi:hypothetical protein